MFCLVLFCCFSTLYFHSSPYYTYHLMLWVQFVLQFLKVEGFAIDWRASFLILSFTDIKFHLSIDLGASHEFWNVVSLFSLISKFSNFPYFFSHCFFRSVFLNFQMLVTFPYFLLHLISFLCGFRTYFV